MTIDPGSPPRPSRAELARDASAAALVLLTLAMPWDLTSDATDHWYVVVASLLAASAVAVSHAARAGVFGPSWDVGYNRLVRYALVAPWLVCLVVVVVVDLFEGGDQDFYYGTVEGGIGIGATVGLIGVLLAVQPRPSERTSTETTSEDRAWSIIARVLAAVTVVAFTITTLLQQVWDAGVFTLLLLVLSIVTGIFVALPMIGLLRGSAPWTLSAIATGLFIAAGAVLTLGEGTATFGVSVAAGETAHGLGYGLTFFVAAATAAAAPRAVGAEPGPLAAENFRPAAARFMAMLALIGGVGAFTVAVAMNQLGSSDGGLVTCLIVYVAIAVAAALGSAELWNRDGLTTALVGIAVYVVGVWITVIVSPSDFTPTTFSSYLVPFLAGATALVLAVGPGRLVDSIRSAAGGFAVEGSTPVPPAPADDATPVVAAAEEAPERPPHDVAAGAGTGTTAVQPTSSPIEVSRQDWGELAPQATPRPTPPPMPAPGPAVATSTAQDPILRAAADPSTPAAELADIVSQHPHAWATVAANPATYPALLEWLALVDDPDVAAALATRSDRS